MQNHVTTELSLSDKVVLGDLLRFYNPKGFKKVDKKSYSYKYADGMKLLKEMDKKKKTDLLNKLKKKDTLNLYKTDAPELK